MHLQHNASATETLDATVASSVFHGRTVKIALFKLPRELIMVLSLATTLSKVVEVKAGAEAMGAVGTTTGMTNKSTTGATDAGTTGAANKDNEAARTVFCCY